MLCKHTYAGVPYLSLFLDKKLVASNFAISTYDIDNGHTFSTETVSDLTSTAYPLTIGTSQSSTGVIGTFFSGNINLLRIERGTNPNLSTALLDSSFRTYLKSSSQGSLATYNADGTITTANSYMQASSDKDLTWCTGNLSIMNYSKKFESSVRSNGFEQWPSNESQNAGAYPSLDSWYLSSVNPLGNSSASKLEIPGGTELFIDLNLE